MISIEGIRILAARLEETVKGKAVDEEKSEIVVWAADVEEVLELEAV